MLGLQAAQLVEQRVVGVVADLGIVEDVVAVVVVRELAPQLGYAVGRPAMFAKRTRKGIATAARLDFGPLTP